MVGVQRIVTLCVGNGNGSFVVHQCGQALIECIERDEDAFFLILKALGGAEIHTQHGAFAIGAVFAGTAKQTDSIQHLAQQIELIGNKGVHLCEIRRILVQFHFRHIARELEQRIKGICLSGIKRFQFGLRFCTLFQDTLLDNFCHIAGRQGQPGVKAALNLGEVYIIDSLNFINGFLCGDQNPRFAMALNCQIMLQRLKIQHHIGVITDVLTNLIHAENHMMIVALTFNMFTDELGKIFRADAVFFAHTVTPAACRFLTHHTLLNQCLHKRILCKVDASHSIIPAAAFQFFYTVTELLQLSICIQLPLQICHARILVGITQFLVECPQKNHGDHIACSGTTGAALGGNIEQDHVRADTFCCADVCQNLRVRNLIVLDKIFQCRLACNFFIADQVRQHLQEVRFTTSKEAGNPDTDTISICANASTVI